MDSTSPQERWLATLTTVLNQHVDYPVDRNSRRTCSPCAPISPRLDASVPSAAAWIPTLLALALLAPFLGKAFTIDDPLFIWSARQIQKNPLDPYGFDLNWFGDPRSMHINVQNPPATSYWLALGGFVSWNEYWLHLTMLPWPILLICGVSRMARRVGADPLWAPLLVLGTSAFLVSATNLMCDVMMLAIMVWGIALWAEGLERRSLTLLTVAAALGGVSALTKYFAIAIIPLLAVYTVIRCAGHERLWRTLALLAPLSVTCLMIAIWHFWSQTLYGASHVTGAAEFAKDFNVLGNPGAGRFYSTFAFVGGCLIWPLVVALWRGSKVVWTLTVVGTALGFFVLREITDGAPATGAANRYASAPVLGAIFCAAGVAAMYLAGSFLWKRRREAEAWLLGLWVFGTIFFASALNWTVAARNVLPLVPPLALLACMHSPQRPTGPQRGSRPTGPRTLGRPLFATATAAATGLVLALLAAHADFTWANAVRQAAVRLATENRFEGRTVFFQGHWGFQYYMMEHGAVPMNLLRTDFRRTDVLVAPLINTNVNLTAFSGWRSQEIGGEGTGWGVSLVDRAGFYSSVFGPNPMSLGVLYRDRYVVLAPPN